MMDMFFLRLYLISMLLFPGYPSHCSLYIYAIDNAEITKKGPDQSFQYLRGPPPCNVNYGGEECCRMQLQVQFRDGIAPGDVMIEIIKGNVSREVKRSVQF